MKWSFPCAELVYELKSAENPISEFNHTSSSEERVVAQSPQTNRITQLLADWSKGDQAALEQLTPLVYKELRLFGFVEMMLFIGVVLAGYWYLWKTGSLDWTKN